MTIPLFYSKKGFSNTFLEILRDFHKNYARAMMLFGDASLDYAASRCCMINGILYRGHSLACEAVEKSLKAIYFMQTKKSHHERKHNLLNIKKDIGNNIFLDKYNSLLQFLTDAHKARYTESNPHFPGQGLSYNAKDYLKDIDSLWADIFDNLEMPDEIKYRLAWFVPVLAMEHMKYHSAWLTIENETLAVRYQALVKRGLEILDPDGLNKKLFVTLSE